MPVAAPATVAGPGRSRLVGLAGLVSVLTMASCSSKSNAQPDCDDDQMCGDGQVCMMGKCLPRGGDRTTAIEIIPKTDSSSARTGLPEKALSTDAIELIAEGRTVVVATVAGAPDGHVVMTTAPPIPGQADLRIETDLADLEFRLSIAESLLRSKATVWLSPTDKSPPAPFSIMLNQTVGLAFPAVSEMTPIRGTLQDALGTPQAGYVARAMAGGRVISNVMTTGATGEFQLLIAPGSTQSDPATAAAMVSIDFTPPTAVDSLSRFVTPSFAAGVGAASATPALYRLPAFVPPAPLRFKIQLGDQGADKAGESLKDFAVRFHTDLMSSKDGKDGTGIYEREERTDGQGEVQVRLIPGSATEPRNYRITILPPPNSAYASRCVAQHPVTNVGSDNQVQYSATFNLVPRVGLTGTVMGSDMKPASNVNVTATFIPGNTLCADVTSTSAVSASTDRNGVYAMLLDPGTYRLDVDPPSGAPWPRQTEDGDRAIVIAGTPVTHDIVLPAGEVIVGHVSGADQGNLDAATLKFFEILCKTDTCSGTSRVAPALRSQATTDSNGNFRAVLPAIH